MIFHLVSFLSSVLSCNEGIDETSRFSQPTKSQAVGDAIDKKDVPEKQRFEQVPIPFIMLDRMFIDPISSNQKLLLPLNAKSFEGRNSFIQGKSKNDHHVESVILRTHDSVHFSSELPVMGIPHPLSNDQSSNGGQPKFIVDEPKKSDVTPSKEISSASRDTFTDLFELFSDIVPIFDPTIHDSKVVCWDLHSKIHDEFFKGVIRPPSKFIMLKLSSKGNPAILLHKFTTFYLDGFRFERIVPPVTIFVGTTPQGKKRSSSLFTIFVPKMIGEFHQYNTNFKAMPKRISKRDETHFNFIMSYTTLNNRKIRETRATFHFPGEKVYREFLKTRFIGFHLNQIILFEFASTKRCFKIKFVIRKLDSLEEIKSLIAQAKTCIEIISE